MGHVRWLGRPDDGIQPLDIHRRRIGNPNPDLQVSSSIAGDRPPGDRRPRSPASLRDVGLDLELEGHMGGDTFRRSAEAVEVGRMTYQGPLAVPGPRLDES